MQQTVGNLLACVHAFVRLKQIGRESGTLRETKDGIGFYRAEKPTKPEGEHFNRPRAIHPTDAPEQKGAEDRPALGETIAAMRQTLKTGVQVVTAPQLFPTPADLAARMVELADIHTARPTDLRAERRTGVLLQSHHRGGADRKRLRGGAEPPALRRAFEHDYAA